MPELVYNVKFKIDPNVGTGDSAITVYKEQAEQLTVELEKAQEQLRLLKGGKGSGSFKGMGEDIKNVGKSFSTANQAIFSFSDGIQDAAQFSQGFSSGMRAVGNNIGFTFELMANLDRKVEEYNETNGAAITRLDALKQAIFQTDKEGNILRNSFGLMKLSATGFVLALNTAITVVTMVSTALSNYSRKAKEAEGATSEFTSAVKQYYDLVSGSATQSRLEADVEFYRRRVDVLDEAKKLQDELNTNLKASAQTQGQYSNQLFIERKEIEQKISNNKELQDQLGIQIDDYDELTKNVSSATQKLKAFTEGTSEAETEIGRYHQTVKDQANISLDLFQTRVEGGTAAVFRSIRVISELEKTYVEEIRTGKTELLPLLKEIIDVRKKLTDSIDDQIAAQREARSEQIREQAELLALFLSAPEMEVDTEYEKTLEDRAIKSNEIRNRILWEASTLFQKGLSAELLKIENDYQKDRLEIIKNGVNVKENLDLLDLKKELQIKKAHADQLKKEQSLISAFQIRATATARDTVDGINKYYDNKQLQEKQNLLDSGIENEEVYSALSQAIEAEKQRALTKLAKDGDAARVESRKASERLILSSITGLFSSISSLNQAQEAESYASAKRQFETNKKLSYASAVVAGGAAIVEVMRDTKAELVGRLIASGIMAAAVGVQLAQIKQQQFEYGGGGGGVGGGGSSASGKSSFGFQMSNVQGSQTFRTPGFTPSNQQMQPKFVINQQLKADRKQLYILNKLGEEEYRQVKV